MVYFFVVVVVYLFMIWIILMIWGNFVCGIGNFNYLCVSSSLLLIMNSWIPMVMVPSYLILILYDINDQMFRERGLLLVVATKSRLSLMQILCWMWINGFVVGVKGWIMDFDHVCSFVRTKYAIAHLLLVVVEVRDFYWFKIEE